jgi:hypothetical protein
VNYQDLRAANAQTYRQQYPLRVLGIRVPGTTSWGPLSGCLAQMRSAPTRVAQSIADEQCIHGTPEDGVPQTTPRQSRGLGDVVAKALDAVGIKKQTGCGCGKRQEWLNRVLPFK